MSVSATGVGEIAYLSMPGEPFPEVRLTIARATPGASAVVALSKGQDDFGYFFPSYDYVFPELYNSDHLLFSVAPQAGDQVIQDQVGNLGRLGFATQPALESPLPNRYAQKLKPGLQTMASIPLVAALGRAETSLCQRRTLRRLSGNVIRAGRMKSTATKPVISATV